MVWLFQRLLQQQHQPRTSLKPLPLPCPEAPASAQPVSQPGEVWVAREGSRRALAPSPLQQSWHTTGSCRWHCLRSWGHSFSGVCGTLCPDPTDLGSDLAGCILCI